VRPRGVCTPEREPRRVAQSYPLTCWEDVSTQDVVRRNGRTQACGEHEGLCACALHLCLPLSNQVSAVSESGICREPASVFGVSNTPSSTASRTTSNRALVDVLPAQREQLAVSKARENRQPDPRPWERRQRREERGCLACRQRPFRTHAPQRRQIDASRRIHRVLPAMLAAGDGCIVNIASTAGLRGFTRLLPIAPRSTVSSVSRVRWPPRRRVPASA